jgi:maltose alpha-D-glucosyltransferase/alpha-amylase
MTEVIRIRKECPEIGTGAWRILPPRSRRVLAIVYARGRSSVLCVHNFDAEPKEISLDLKSFSGGERLRSLLGNDESHRSVGRHRVRLEPLGYDWYRTA